jgi:hypothetical protein
LGYPFEWSIRRKNGEPRRDVGVTDVYPFDAGPRSSAPVGDPSTQAVAALGGYAYQLYASGIAWVSLRSDETLYLEIARDYAVATANALKTVEVKRTTASITLNSPLVRDALASFVDLTHRNSDRTVYFHYLTTSDIGQEKTSKTRADGQPALAYWRRAAAGAPVEPLRTAMLSADIAEPVRRYIETLDDEGLREQFLRRIHWDCGQPGINDITSELQTALVRYAIANGISAASGDGAGLSDAVLHALLDRCVKPGSRDLHPADLLALVRETTSVRIPQAQLEQLLAKLNGPSGALVVGDDSLDFVDLGRDLPFPGILTKRDSLVSEIAARARESGLVVLTGSTGLGKTLVARLVARALSLNWGIADFRELSAPVSADKLNLGLSHLSRRSVAVVILDDLNAMEEPACRRALARFVASARRRDLLIIVTAYNEPPVPTLTECGIGKESVWNIPQLTVEEVSEMVGAAGGDAAVWAKPIHTFSYLGHPQFVQAMLQGLRSRGWPDSELTSMQGLVNSEDVEAARATIRRLGYRLPPGSQTLLSRLSLLFGRFDRPLVMTIGQLPDAVKEPGKELDYLVGPWIESVGRGQFRSSPLVDRMGQDTLTEVEQRAVHDTAARYLVGGEAIDINNANFALLHGLHGQSSGVLSKLAFAIMAAGKRERPILSERMWALRAFRRDRAIFASDPNVSLTLRFAQFILVCQRSESAEIRECWKTVGRELQTLQDKDARSRYEFLFLAKVLCDLSIAAMLEGWMELILRFEALAQNDPARKQLMAGMERQLEGLPGSIAGTLFLTQVSGIKRAADLLQVFVRLDAAPSDTRMKLLEGVLSSPAAMSLFVDRAWLAESQAPNTQWPKVKDAYQQMLLIAQKWCLRDLAFRCCIACAVIEDEYLNDSAAAEQRLRDAMASWNNEAVLERALAKVFFRRRDHRGTLDILRRVARDPRISDPVDKTYVFREAGISAGELGEWSESSAWFMDGSRAAGLGKAFGLKVMSVGLEADAGVSAAQAGNVPEALARLYSAINRLGNIDPTCSVTAGYCHRVVRHAILWLAAITTGRSYLVEGEPPRVMPGMCSNPAPADLSGQPLGSSEYAKYLLVEAEIASASGNTALSLLRAELEGSSIPTMEIVLRQTEMARAIGDLDAKKAVKLIPQWVECQLWLARNQDQYQKCTPLNPVFGRIEPPTPEQSQSPRAAITAEDVLVSFGIHAALARRPEALGVLLEEVAVGGSDAKRTLVAAMSSGTPASGRYESVVRCVHRVAHKPDIGPGEVYGSAVWFVHTLAGSNFGQFVAPSLERWLRKHWQQIVDTQKFMLRAPRVTVPEIADVLSSNAVGLKFAAKLLLAAQKAVDVNLGAEVEPFLKKLVKAEG